MVGRFKEDERLAFFRVCVDAFDVAAFAAWGTCPYCGHLLAIGKRRDTGNVNVKHSNPEPLLNQEPCEALAAILQRDDFLLVLKGKMRLEGVRLEKLVG